MAKFKFHVGTGYVGSEVEMEYKIPDEELEGLDEMERIKVISEHFEDWVWSAIDDSSYWKELDE